MLGAAADVCMAMTELEVGVPVDDGEVEAAVGVGEIDLGDLAGYIGYLLRRAQLAVFADFHRSLAALEIRPAQYGVLLMMRQTPGLRQSQVADVLGIKRANFVTLFDGLQARGLAHRVPSASDRRAVCLFLTAYGQEQMQIIEALVAAHEARLATALGEGGRTQLLELLARLQLV